MNFIIRPMNEQDWPDVAEIYRQGIATGKATFQSEIPEYKDWNASHLSICRYVAVADEEVAFLLNTITSSTFRFKIS